MASPHRAARAPPQLLLLLPALLALALALEPDAALYDAGPVRFDATGELWYGADLRAGTASLALRVTDRAVVNASASAVWAGVGVSEATSGSMLGGDIVTAEFTADAACDVTDRYVPFVPYPLTESPGAFPLPDACQDDGSWTVRRCARDLDNGQLLIEVVRPIDAHDTQDMPLVAGRNSIIYAYGNEFAYHGGNRGAMGVSLFTDRDDPDSKPPAGDPPLPDDVDGSFEIRATDFEVLSNMTTTYACTTRRFDLGPAGKRMIVAAEPIIDAPIDMVHHFVVYQCTNAGYARLTKNTTTCMSLNGISGPLANPAAGCSTFVYGYAKGIGRTVIPREAGILVDAKRPFVVMETHFDNSKLVKGNIDKSGVRLFYTDTMRNQQSGALLLGDGLLSRYGDKVKTDFEYEHSCPSECTSKFSTNINIFGSFLHMHTTGRDIYTNVFSANGTYVDTMNKINFWSDKFQQIRQFDPPYVLKPGQQMVTTCTYDTSKRPGTRFGIETTDEMCVEFLFYWPLQFDPDTGDEINLCAFDRSFEDKSETFTVCGDNGNIGDEDIFLPVPNPKFEDEVGAPTDFGDAPTCPVPDVLAASPAPDLLEASPVPAPASGSPPSASPVAAGGAPETSVAAGSAPETSVAAGSAPETSAAAGSAPETSVAAGGAPETGDASPAATSSDDDEDDDDDDDAACFPGSATVELRDGSVRRMDALHVGDEVVVSGGGETSRVVLFTHRARGAAHAFVELGTSCGRALVATRGHYVYADGAAVTAGQVGVGAAVRARGGEPCVVTHKKTVQASGLYNPQTAHGDIVVDGIAATTYTTAVPPAAAHALLAPVRWAVLAAARLAPRCATRAL